MARRARDAERQEWPSGALVRADFSPRSLTEAVDPFLMIEWGDLSPVLALPATVGLAWRLEELGPDIEDPDGFLSDREYYERGYRWCECYSTWEPDGDRGYVAAANLVPLHPAEFDAARASLRRSPDAFNRAVWTLFDRAIRRLD